MKQDSIRIAADSQAKFNNNTAFCIGTGRMGLALQQLSLIHISEPTRH